MNAPFSPIWWVTKDGDKSCLALYERHYSFCLAGRPACRSFTGGRGMTLARQDGKSELISTELSKNYAEVRRRLWSGRDCSTDLDVMPHYLFLRRRTMRRLPVPPPPMARETTMQGNHVPQYLPPRLPDGVVRLADEEQIDGPEWTDVVHVPSAQMIRRIQRVVAEYYGIPLDELISDRRITCVALARQIAMYLAKLLTPRSLAEIGRRFGDRDHSTVHHAVRKIEALAAKDPGLAADIEAIKQALGAP